MASVYRVGGGSAPPQVIRGPRFGGAPLPRSPAKAPRRFPPYRIYIYNACARNEPARACTAAGLVLNHDLDERPARHF